jgi:hypothetical protein
MNIVTILVVRSKACHVKTLHSVLRLNMRCLQKNYNNEITYVDDDPYKKAEAIQKYMKTCDRIIFIDFGVGVDDGSLDQCFEPHEHVGCLVFPGVKEGINWDQFKTKVQEGSSEPASQMGLDFDTEIGKKVSKDIYHVTSTKSKAWFLNTKNVSKKSGWKISPKFFEKFISDGVRVYAFTAAKLTMTYTHECLSNILNAAGVKVS